VTSGRRIGPVVLLALATGCAGGAHPTGRPARVVRVSSATPSTGLRDRQRVAVVARTHLARSSPTARLLVHQCPSVTPAHGDCTQVGTVAVDPVRTVARDELTFTGTVRVRSTVGWIHRFACTDQCVLIVDDFFTRYGAEVPLTFGSPAPRPEAGTGRPVSSSTSVVRPPRPVPTGPGRDVTAP